jgi:uncharacterized RDD family membrane protein YckC
MTRDEQLNYCKTCKNQKFSMNQGVICRLTNQAANFEGTCFSFEEDVDLVNRLQKNDTKSTGRIASQGKRFTNFILDTIFYLIFCAIIGFVLGIVFAIFSPSLLSIFNEENKIISYLIGFIALFIYYSILEALTGRTIAKFITKTKVINENGLKPDYREILLRTICRFIPFDAFSYLSDDNLGWHDKLSKTKVVEV